MVKTTKNKIVYEKNINEVSGKALVIVFPDSAEELKNLVKISSSDIVPRAGGTSFTLSTLPKNSVIVDLSKMNKIVDFNPNKKTIVVEPGIILNELNEELEEHGLEFPISSIFPGIETIGGMIAKNSSGSREIKYNRTINWVESLQVINGKGEQIRVSKSDLSDFTGMEGTTGIIIQATLRLTAKKKHSVTILKSEKLDFIVDANKKLRLEQDISAIDILSKQLSQILGFEKKYHLFVEYESEKGLFKEKDYARFMKTKNKAYTKIAAEGFYLIESIKVSSDSLEDFLIYLEENNIPYFGHLASGVIYPCFHPTQKEKQLEVLNFAKKLRANISYNLGFGLKNKDFIPLGDRELLKRVKLRQDPQNKINSGKIYDPFIKSEKKIELVFNDSPVEKKLGEELDPEKITLKKPELTEEEREKVKKIAFGFFGGKKEDKKEEENSGEY